MIKSTAKFFIFYVCVLSNGIILTWAILLKWHRRKKDFTEHVTHLLYCILEEALPFISGKFIFFDWFWCQLIVLGVSPHRSTGRTWTTMEIVTEQIILMLPPLLAWSRLSSSCISPASEKLRHIVASFFLQTIFKKSFSFTHVKLSPFFA